MHFANGTRKSYGKLNLAVAGAVLPPLLAEKDAVPRCDSSTTEDEHGPVYLDIVQQQTDRQPDTVEVATVDNWQLTDSETAEETGKKWKDLDNCGRFRSVIGYVVKLLVLLACLYTFICSLDVLSSAFRLLGGRTAGAVFRDSQLLRNPVSGLMIGVLATVLVQSSSTSTSIVVSMVASDILDVRAAIPIIMGANIGTSLTNTLVSVTHGNDRTQFRRAFAGATVHDMFNWLTVIILLPIEVAFGYLYKLSTFAVESLNVKGQSGHQPPQMLSLLTEPLTNKVVQLDKSMIEKIASGQISDDDTISLVKRYCGAINATNLVENIVNETANWNETDDVNNIYDLSDAAFKPCNHIFAQSTMNDTAIGAILLVASLVSLIGCLVLIVKLLSSILRGQVITAVRKVVNYELPGHFAFLTGYLAILVGALLTILVQSSSVFTSALTPLIGLGVLSVERMYPLTLGANVGTTFTSVLAAMAGSPRTLASALQIAFCHLFFNISGILLFYPLPFARRIPIGAAKRLGEITAKYRWFAGAYVLLMFVLLPVSVFGLSMAGNMVMIAVSIPIVVLLCLIGLINLLQTFLPSLLPERLRDWQWLPLWMRSLEPIDRRLTSCCPERTCCRSSSSGTGTLSAWESRRRLLNNSTTPSRSNSSLLYVRSTPSDVRQIP